MANWWITTIMLAFILFCAGSFFIHFLKRTLHTEDSTRIDPDPEWPDPEEYKEE
ncbi:hypothetical protein [Falsibacillus pallidus]|uniref:Uncharacterized protein n=1 Tax=Falsibacillus pallidus TaxID=493781 RepID=A0A370GF27_9BACI|nr:hypothetical protein [Falsibacillus pallidus]RDI42287.1 hypothetical protein DFR59_105128 [Falsibacillus pallidus]